MSLEAPRHAANAGPRRIKMRLERDDRVCGGLGLWRWWCAESSVPRRRGRQSAWLRAKGLCPESRRSATPPLRLYYASATPPLAGSCGALSRLLSLGRPWGAVPFGGGGGASTTTVNEGQALHITWHFHSQPPRHTTSNNRPSPQYHTYSVSSWLQWPPPPGGATVPLSGPEQSCSSCGGASCRIVC
jgi:hypothetical protein